MENVFIFGNAYIARDKMSSIGKTRRSKLHVINDESYSRYEELMRKAPNSINSFVRTGSELYQDTMSAFIERSGLNTDGRTVERALNVFMIEMLTRSPRVIKGALESAEIRARRIGNLPDGKDTGYYRRCENWLRTNARYQAADIALHTTNRGKALDIWHERILNDRALQNTVTTVFKLLGVKGGRLKQMVEPFSNPASNDANKQIN